MGNIKIRKGEFKTWLELIHADVINEDIEEE